MKSLIIKTIEYGIWVVFWVMFSPVYANSLSVINDFKHEDVVTKSELKDDEYHGERLSLSFQEIEIRAVLQLLAEFSNLNIVVSDTVQGSVTLNLINTRWDQILAIILKSKGLAMRQLGDIMLIADAEEIAAREKQELALHNELMELAPLRSELLQINYAKSLELAKMLKSGNVILLSERGSITADERTNTILVRDTTERIEEIKQLIESLDVPVRQVLIESRIVIADNAFAKDLGAKLGIRSEQSNGGNAFLTSGSVAGLGVSSAIDFGNNLNINLPAVVSQGAPASIALGFISPGALLDLELQALQTESRGEVVSSPRIITLNQKKAIIEQGTQIPYQEATSSGATSTSFRKAVMKLEVTPQITPDGRVMLDILINKDSVSNLQNARGALAIDTNQVQTQVLINDGETVVLGGIYEQSQRMVKTKVPLLGDIPFLGALFRSTSKTDEKFELLIFVTPKIIEESHNFTHSEHFSGRSLVSGAK